MFPVNLSLFKIQIKEIRLCKAHSETTSRSVFPSLCRSKIQCRYSINQHNQGLLEHTAASEVLTKEYFEVQNNLFSSLSWFAYGPFAATCLKLGMEENNVGHCVGLGVGASWGTFIVYLCHKEF